jgi:hypothetical protein
MKKGTLVARKVNRSVYRRFRQKALEAKESVGNAVTEAMEYWLKAKHLDKQPNPEKLLQLNGIIKAGKRVRWSEEIDEILYRGTP